MKLLVPSDPPPFNGTGANSATFQTFHTAKAFLATSSAVLMLVSQFHPHKEHQPLDGSILAVLHDYEVKYSTSPLPGLNVPIVYVSTSSDIRPYIVNGVDIYAQLRDKIPGGIFELTGG